MGLGNAEKLIVIYKNKQLPQKYNMHANRLVKESLGKKDYISVVQVELCLPLKILKEQLTETFANFCKMEEAEALGIIT